MHSEIFKQRVSLMRMGCGIRNAVSLRVNAFERSASTERMLLLIDIIRLYVSKIMTTNGHHDDGSQKSFSFAKFAAQPPNSHIVQRTSSIVHNQCVMLHHLPKIACWDRVFLGTRVEDNFVGMQTEFRLTRG